MIRIFTFNIPISSDINQIDAGIDEGALATMLVKYTSNNLLRSGSEESQKILRTFLTSMVSKGRRFSSLLYFAHSLLCSDILRIPAPRGADGRMASIIGIRACSVNDALLKLYPRFFALENLDEMLPLTQQSFAYGTVFIVHTNNSIYIWVSPATSSETLQSVCKVLEKEFGRPITPIETEIIKTWDYSIEIIKLAIAESISSGIFYIKYIDKILYHWKRANVRTVTEAKNYSQRFRQRKGEEKNKSDSKPSKWDEVRKKVRGEQL